MKHRRSAETPCSAQGLLKRLDSSLGPAQDQRMNIVRTLIGIDDFEIYHVTDYGEFVRDAVSSKHVACKPRDVECLAA